MRHVSFEHRKDTSLPQVDITAPEKGVSVESSSDGKVLWVNVDGVCVLRVCKIPYLSLDCPGLGSGSTVPDEEFQQVHTNLVRDLKETDRIIP